MADQEEMERIETSLRHAGWADHASIARELRTWARVAVEVDIYAATVDDYTNDLCSRDYLDVMSRQVVESADGCAADGGVDPVVIVEVDPARQGCSSLGL